METGWVPTGSPEGFPEWAGQMPALPQMPPPQSCGWVFIKCWLHVGLKTSALGRTLLPLCRGTQGLQGGPCRRPHPAPGLDQGALPAAAAHRCGEAPGARPPLTSQCGRRAGPVGPGTGSGPDPHLAWRRCVWRWTWTGWGEQETLQLHSSVLLAQGDPCPGWPSLPSCGSRRLQAQTGLRSEARRNNGTLDPRACAAEQRRPAARPHSVDSDGPECSQKGQRPFLGDIWTVGGRGGREARSHRRRAGPAELQPCQGSRFPALDQPWTQPGVMALTLSGLEGRAREHEGHCPLLTRLLPHHPR